MPRRLYAGLDRHRAGGLLVGLVGEVRSEPALHLRQRPRLPRGVRCDLVAPDPADREVARLGVMEVEPGDRGGGRDGERLRQREAVLLRAEQLEQLPLLRVVGARGVAEGRPDAAVALGDQLLIRAAAALLVPRTATLLVQVLGERLCQSVGERLRQDRPVVVVVALEPRRDLVGAEDPDYERPEMVACAGGRDVVSQRAVRP